MWREGERVEEGEGEERERERRGDFKREKGWFVLCFVGEGRDVCFMCCGVVCSVVDGN